jgi:hypothetical protein
VPGSGRRSQKILLDKIAKYCDDVEYVRESRSTGYVEAAALSGTVKYVPARARAGRPVCFSIRRKIWDFSKTKTIRK